MPIQVRLASTNEELLACRRFWYRVYIEEMQRHLTDEEVTCHKTKTLRSEYDNEGRLLLAWSGHELIGAILNNYPRDTDVGFYETFYQMDLVGDSHPTSTSITTKLMVDSKYRNGPAGLMMAIESFKAGLKDNIRFNFIDCNSHLIPYFKRLGWVEHLGWIDHYDYGQVYSMILDLNDIQHLESVDSPFLSVI